MIRKLDQFTGLLGWRQGQCPATIDATNLAASVTRKFEEFSSLVTTENLWYTNPEFDDTLTVSAQTTAFNEWIRQIVTSSIDQVFNYIFKQIEDLIHNDLIYPYEFDFNHPIDNDSDFVGFEIEIVKDKRFTNRINTLHLTFDANDTVKVLLFDSSKKAAIENVEISVLENTTVDEVVDWYLPYTTGKYYLGYLTSGLTAKACDRNYELGNLQRRYAYANFDEIKVSGHNVETLFDVNDISHQSNTWGINCDISVYRDWTHIGIQNKEKFINAIGMQVAVNCLDLFINSNRSNNKERIARANAILALEGNNNPNLGLFTQGLRTRLQEEINSLRKLFIKTKRIGRGTLS